MVPVTSVIKKSDESLAKQQISLKTKILYNIKIEKY